MCAERKGRPQSGFHFTLQPAARQCMRQKLSRLHLAKKNCSQLFSNFFLFVLIFPTYTPTLMTFNNFDFVSAGHLRQKPVEQYFVYNLFWIENVRKTRLFMQRVSENRHNVYLCSSTVYAFGHLIAISSAAYNVWQLVFMRIVLDIKKNYGYCIGIRHSLL